MRSPTGDVGPDMKVEIWSDVVCPWCAIGRARFESALAGFPHRDEVQVRWRSFQLDATAPREREGDRAAHLAEKFTDGEPIGDPETLVRVVAEAGVDAEAARAVLEDGRYADDVGHDQEQARRYGISGVPFFVIDERYGVSGAQPADALREVLDTAWAESQPLTVLTPAVGADGEACTDGSCSV